jgi:GntR family transcriptional regulator
LARRFHLHHNTISAGYRQLERNQWVEFRKGSGVYVRKQKPESRSSTLALDQLITKFFHSAREIGVSLADVRSRLRHWLELQPPDHFLLLEPETRLAEILVVELQKAVALPVKMHSIVEPGLDTKLIGAVPVCLAMKEKQVRGALLDDAELLTLDLRSVGDSLAIHLPAPSTALIGVASGWPTFLKTAHTMLIAAGFNPDCLVLRDTSHPIWRRGLKDVAAVICDSLTAQKLDGISRVLQFPLLAESSLQKLKRYEEFIRLPLKL